MNKPKQFRGNHAGGAQAAQCGGAVLSTASRIAARAPRPAAAAILRKRPPLAARADRAAALPLARKWRGTDAPLPSLPFLSKNDPPVVALRKTARA